VLDGTRFEGNLGTALLLRGSERACVYGALFEGNVRGQGPLLQAHGQAPLQFDRNLVVGHGPQALALGQSELASALFNATDSLESLGEPFRPRWNYELDLSFEPGDGSCQALRPGAGADDRWLVERGIGALPYDVLPGECLPIDRDEDGVDARYDCNDRRASIGRCAVRWASCDTAGSAGAGWVGLLGLLALAKRRISSR
jgi:hypothetical protein